jgi:hypothetical protein
MGDVKSVDPWMDNVAVTLPVRIGLGQHGSAKCLGDIEWAPFGIPHESNPKVLWQSMGVGDVKPAGEVTIDGGNRDSIEHVNLLGSVVVTNYGDVNCGALDDPGFIGPSEEDIARFLDAL